MHKIQALAGEQPPVERARNRRHEAVPMPRPFPLVQPLALVEFRQSSEDGVEVVPWKVIEQQTQLWQPAAQLLALPLHRLDDLGGHEQCVGPRRAAQVSDGDACGKDGAVHVHDGLLRHGLC